MLKRIPKNLVVVASIVVILVIVVVTARHFLTIQKDLSQSLSPVEVVTQMILNMHNIKSLAYEYKSQHLYSEGPGVAEGQEVLVDPDEHSESVSSTGKIDFTDWSKPKISLAINYRTEDSWTGILDAFVDVKIIGKDVYVKLGPDLNYFEAIGLDGFTDQWIKVGMNETTGQPNSGKSPILSKQLNKLDLFVDNLNKSVSIARRLDELNHLIGLASMTINVLPDEMIEGTEVYHYQINDGQIVDDINQRFSSKETKLDGIDIWIRKEDFLPHRIRFGSESTYRQSFVLTKVKSEYNLRLYDFNVRIEPLLPPTDFLLTEEVTVPAIPATSSSELSGGEL